MTKGTRRSVIGAAGLVGWFALALQLHLALEAARGTGASTTFTVGNYFGYFTILTNTLTALTFTWPALAPDTRPGRFFASPVIVAAVAMYMVGVSVVYNLLLRGLWHPTGALLVADTLLHQVMPLACVTYWLAWTPRGHLRWAHAVGWLAYPVVYFAYMLLRGVAFRFYPYPFFDVAALGYLRVVENGLGLLGAFLLLGLALVWTDRRRTGSTRDFKGHLQHVQ